MAFEAFLTQDKAKPSKWRRITYTASLGLHVVLLVVMLIKGFWQVEELSPPNVVVTFMSAAPAPPPPPPPAKKKTQTKPKPTMVVQPKANQIVQPKKQEEPEEEDEGVEGGVEGGIAGGVVGGVVGNEPPKTVPPSVASGQLAIDPQNAQYKPGLPPALNRAGNRVWGLFKICVEEKGSVKSVVVVKSADPLVDADWSAKIKNTWRYKPYAVNGRPVPFCYVLRLDVTASL